MTRRLATLAVFSVLIAALALPAGAGAADSSQISKLTASYCKAQKKKLGKKGFAKRYGKKKAMKTCIKKQRRVIQNAYRQAEEQCDAELAEFGEEDFLWEWESYDECVEWYADEYMFPSLPGEDPLDEDDEEAEDE